MADLWKDRMDAGDDAAREDERERVREELEVRLMRSGVLLTGSETHEQIVALMNATEAFESARARAGGDSMVNTHESSRPDDQRFVIPTRRDDESVEQYLGRIRQATDRLANTR